MTGASGRTRNAKRTKGGLLPWWVRKRLQEQSEPETSGSKIGQKTRKSKTRPHKFIEVRAASSLFSDLFRTKMANVYPMTFNIGMVFYQPCLMISTDVRPHVQVVQLEPNERVQDTPDDDDSSRKLLSYLKACCDKGLRALSTASAN